MFNIEKNSVVTTFTILIVFMLICAVYTPAQGAAPSKYETAELISVKGQVKSFANPKQSKTISVIIENKGIMVFKYSDDTVFKNFTYLNELTDETVVIKYRTAGPDRIAKVITKSLAEIPDGVRVINTDEMAELIQKGPVAARYFLIDARPAERYEEGHLPGAVSIPVARLKEKGPRLLPPDNSIALIFYDGGVTCGMSTEAAELALKWNYKNTSIYLSGEPAWSKAGHYTISTAEFINEGNVVLIDLRPRETAAAGHIPGAVSIPADQLLEAGNRFPTYKGADIVFYGDRVDNLIFAVKTAHSWGYRKSTIFLGGTGAWELVGNSLEQGPASEEITYKRIIPPGEISIENFEKALNSGEAVIVDVRNPGEYAAGHFTGALNIPVDDITSRYAELPKDRTILTYCITGVRSGMAYTILGPGWLTQSLKNMDMT
jgi:rhodanese-related sulfurtransferase